MEVILREHVEHLGRRGDVVKVAAGYARNYLLPRKLALAVTENNKRQIEREKKLAEARDAGREVGRPRRWPRGSARSRSRSPAGSARTTPSTGRSPRPTSPRRSRPRASRSTSARSSWPIRSRRSARRSVPVKIHRDVTAQVKVKVVADRS